MQQNIMNHLICSPQNDSVYAPGNTKKQRCELKECIIKKAIELLFGNVSSEQQKELIRIAKTEFFNQNSIVWYKCDELKGFNGFLKRNLLNIGRKEIRILEDGTTIFFYKELSGRPTIYQYDVKTEEWKITKG